MLLLQQQYMGGVSYSSRCVYNGLYILIAYTMRIANKKSRTYGTSDWSDLSVLLSALLSAHDPLPTGDLLPELCDVSNPIWLAQRDHMTFGSVSSRERIGSRFNMTLAADPLLVQGGDPLFGFWEGIPSFDFGSRSPLSAWGVDTPFGLTVRISSFGSGSLCPLWVKGSDPLFGLR